MKTYKCWFCNEALKSDKDVMTHFKEAEFCSDQENIELVEVA